MRLMGRWCGDAKDKDSRCLDDDAAPMTAIRWIEVDQCQS